MSRLRSAVRLSSRAVDGRNDTRLTRGCSAELSMSRSWLTIAEHPTMNASLDSVPLTRQSNARAGCARARHHRARRNPRNPRRSVAVPRRQACRACAWPGAWSGPANAPVVCALGGISANRRVCVTEDPRQSWWGQIVGPDRALDVNRFRVLSFDYLGGSGESTAPEEGAAFPSISSYDQAEALLGAAESSRHQVAACHRGRLLRRHGGAGIR